MVLAPVSAQDEEDEFDFNDLSGIQNGVGRYYYADYSAMYDAMATPGAEMPELPALLGLSVGVLQFDNDDNAGSGFDKLYEELVKSANQSLADEAASMGTPTTPVTVDENDVDGVGDQAKSMSAVVEEADGTYYSYGLVAREGEYLYLVIGNGSSDPSEAINNLAKGMIDRDPGDGDGTFNEDGTSTGGLWDLFPADDDPALGGLLNGGDEIIYPEGTPEAGQ
jgi:hypothetical protein